jgi:hypothetical protein
MDSPAVFSGRIEMPMGDRASLIRHLAHALTGERPALAIHHSLEHLQAHHIGPGGSLVIDDVQGISLANRFCDTRYLQERARLRTHDGDTLVTTTPVSNTFEHYCSEQLLLGHPTWLHCGNDYSDRGLASACWRNQEVREELIRRVKSGRLVYLHPHMGNHAVWALASLLSKAAGRNLKVIAPHPGLTLAVNNKVWFSQLVGKLLGLDHMPYSRQASSLSGLASLARQMARDSSRIVIKLPDSAGGAGNLLLRAGELKNQPLGEIRAMLRRKLEPLGWTGNKLLLVSCWESEVISAPSVQAWIPPAADGNPIIEGVFEQMLHGEEGIFEGSHPARLPRHLLRALMQDSAALCELFQLLGYVGRCSFDTIMVGPTAQTAKIEFLECNGRWGGTSLPMTLANRLFGNWRSRPYTSREIVVPGLKRYHFSDLTRQLKQELYDKRTGRGWLVLYNPGHLLADSGIEILCLGKSQLQANERARTIAPRLLETLGHKSINLPVPGASHSLLRLQ